jgi:hypothetical protein
MVMRTAIQAGEPVQVHGEDLELEGADEPGPRRDAGFPADEGERQDPFESIGWAIYTLRVQGMPSEEIAAILGADSPELIRRYFELHRERLDERLADQRRPLGRLEQLLPALRAARLSPTDALRTV